MNILITSVGRRSYLVEYFKEALAGEGEIHVSNSHAFTPAFEFADKSIVSPLIYDAEYIPFLIDYCRENCIDAIVPLFDLDLNILSEHKDEFDKIQVQVIVSDPEIIDVCGDKYKTNVFLNKIKICSPKTFLSIEDTLKSIKSGKISFPIIIKPRWGTGSIAISEAKNEAELNILYLKTLDGIKQSYIKYPSEKNLLQCIIFQKKIVGQEYGLDVINNLDGEYQNTIVKKKYSMRSGETDCAETIENADMMRIGEKLATKLKHVANMDVDIINCGNKYYVLDLNARFGGGYPFSHVAGANLPLAIVKWLKGERADISLLCADAGVMSYKDIVMTRIYKVCSEDNYLM